MKIGQVLDKRFKAIENSDSDIECFKHIHSYLDYLLTTPELKSILDTEEADFYEKVRFTKDNIKLEDLNFYQSYFVPSYVRIYLPIEHYKNSHEPDEKQDPVALLLLYGLNHPRIQKWVNGHEFFTKRERTKQLKSYWSWFDGKRGEYVSEIKNLHLEIITALSKQKEPGLVQLKSETSLKLNLETGDFNYEKATGSFNIKSQPFKVLTKLYLAEGRTVPYLELIQCLKPKAQTVTKPDKAALSTVIRNLKQYLGILNSTKPNEDIIHSEKLVGYSLKNKD